MAVSADFAFLRKLISAGLVAGATLEIGGRSWQGEAGNAARICAEANVPWEAADLVDGPGVNYILDILDDSAVRKVGRQWQSVLMFNILEHLYDPISALRNAATLVQPGGVLAVAGPAVWQLHDFPVDCWRPLPDFYTEFARREGLTLIEEHFDWLVYGELYPVSSFIHEGQKIMPSLGQPAGSSIWGTKKVAWSRAIHKIMRTSGRELAFPYAGLGVAMRRPLPQQS
jgi:SAM-dependent methyltransferase